MIKKLIALMLSVGVILNAFQLNVFAASLIIKSTESNYSYDFQKDGVFDITFVLENSPGIHSGNIKVHYDPSVIQAVESSGNGGTEGYYCYDNEGTAERFFSEKFINAQLKSVLSQKLNGVSLPEGTADGNKTASELGYIILSNFSKELKPMEGDKKLFTMRFKMVSAGSTNVEILPLEASGGNHYFTAFLGMNNNIEDVTSVPAKVTIKSVSNSTQSASQSSTQTTTKNTATSSSSSSSGKTTTNSSSATTTKNTTTTTTTAAAPSEPQTQATSQSQTAANNVESAHQQTEESKDIVFNDIAPYPWAEDAIKELASRKIVSGIGDNLFNPAANVRRCDFLIMLVNALNLEADFSDNFDDVDEGMYYYNAIGIAKALGISNGMGDNTFDPRSFISRQDMMVLAKRAIELKNDVEQADDSVLDKFKDKYAISPYALESLSAMVNMGIINGTGEKIEPRANTTRAQAAVMIYNIISKY